MMKKLALFLPLFVFVLAQFLSVGLKTSSARLARIKIRYYILGLIFVLAVLAQFIARPVFASDGLYFLHTDHLGSTRVVTNQQGIKVAEYDYYPYGAINNQQLSINNQDIERLYTSQIKDSSADLYFYNARYYNPEVGTFISADALGGGYAYGENNPLRFTDPSGNMVEMAGGGGGGIYLPLIFKENNIREIWFNYYISHPVGYFEDLQKDAYEKPFWPIRLAKAYAEESGTRMVSEILAHNPYFDWPGLMETQVAQIYSAENFGEVIDAMAVMAPFLMAAGVDLTEAPADLVKLSPGIYGNPKERLEAFRHYRHDYIPYPEKSDEIIHGKLQYKCQKNWTGNVLGFAEFLKRKGWMREETNRHYEDYKNYLIKTGFIVDYKPHEIPKQRFLVTPEDIDWGDQMLDLMIRDLEKMGE